MEGGGVDGRFHIYLFDHRFFSRAVVPTYVQSSGDGLLRSTPYEWASFFLLLILGVFSASFALDILFKCLLIIALWLFPDRLLCSERSVATGEKHMGGCCILCVCVGGAALL